ncbi:MAG TPA: AAA family ATPase, partial [Longimicrobiales bacterium]
MGEELWLEEGAVSADVLAFREAVAAEAFAVAAARYRGPFLDGFWLSGAAPWQAWQEEQRDDLERLARQVLRHLLAAAETRGDWLEVERVASRLLEFDAFDEGVHRARIAAIAASGDQARAIAEYQRLEALLRRELGRGPSAESAELGGRLVAPTLVLPAAPEESDDGFLTSFVGRVDEFRSLRDDWRSVGAGDGRTVIVSGEAGIGKTRFCRHFLRWAVLQGARILRGRCYAAERRIPYSGVTDALLSGVRPEDLDALSPAWSGVVGELLPEFRTESSDRPAGSLEGEGARRRLFEGIAQLLMAIGRPGPVILFIDDLHWADDSTVALVHYLARRLHASPVLILAALRTEEVEADSELASLRSRQGDRARIRYLPLPELDPASITALIDSYENRKNVRIAEPTREWIGRKVGGRPFLILEMLKVLGDGRLAPAGMEWSGDAGVGPEGFVPESVEEFLNSRCRGLGREATEVMSSLAVLGREASLEVVEGVSGVTGGDLARALDELKRKGIIDDESHYLSFVHDLLREAAHRALSGARRRILHARAAEVLNRAGSAPPGTLALHYDLAGKREQAYRYAMEAAAASERVFARNEAESFLRLALRNARGTEAVMARDRIARLLHRGARYVEAEEHFSVLENHYRKMNDIAGQVLVELNRIVVQQVTGSPPIRQPLARLEALMATAERLGDIQVMSDALRAFVRVLHDIGDRDLMVKLLARMLGASAEFTRTAEGVRTLAHAIVGMGVYQSVTEALKRAEPVMQLAAEIDDPWTTVAAMVAHGKIALYAGRLRTAERELTTARRIAERAAHSGEIDDIQIALLAMWAEGGDYDRVEVIFKEIVRTAEQQQAVDTLVYAYGNMSSVCFEQHQLERAATLAHRMLSWNEGSVPWFCHLKARSILGLCALARGDLDEGRQYRPAVLATYKGPEFFGDDISYIELFLARLAAAEGDREGAVARLERGIAAFEDRDVFCRSRMQLERARLLMESDPREAWRQAGEVRRVGVEAGARP